MWLFVDLIVYFERLLLFKEDGYPGDSLLLPGPGAAETPDSWSPKAGAEAGTSAKGVSDKHNFLSIFVSNVFVP